MDAKSAEELDQDARLGKVGAILFRGLQRLRAKEARGKLTIVGDGQSRKGRRSSGSRSRRPDGENGR